MGGQHDYSGSSAQHGSSGYDHPGGQHYYSGSSAQHGSSGYDQPGGVHDNSPVESGAPTSAPAWPNSPVISSSLVLSGVSASSFNSDPAAKSAFASLVSSIAGVHASAVRNIVASEFLENRRSSLTQVSFDILIPQTGTDLNAEANQLTANLELATSSNELQQALAASGSAILATANVDKSKTIAALQASVITTPATVDCNSQAANECQNTCQHCMSFAGCIPGDTSSECAGMPSDCVNCEGCFDYANCGGNDYGGTEQQSGNDSTGGQQHGYSGAGGQDGHSGYDSTGGQQHQSGYSGAGGQDGHSGHDSTGGQQHQSGYGGFGHTDEFDVHQSVATLTPVGVVHTKAEYWSSAEQPFTLEIGSRVWYDSHHGFSQGFNGIPQQMLGGKVLQLPYEMPNGTSITLRFNRDVSIFVGIDKEQFISAGWSQYGSELSNLGFSLTSNLGWGQRSLGKEFKVMEKHIQLHTDATMGRFVLPATSEPQGRMCVVLIDH